MAHIHEKIDYVVAAYIIYDQSVLLVFHNQLQKWLPIGGHIEIEEDPEQALFREIEEESGLKAEELEILSNKPGFESAGTKFLYTPNYLDIHEISDTHKHIGLIYFVRAKTNVIKLAEKEHSDIKWVKQEELENYNLSPSLKFYCAEAFRFAN